MTITYRDTKGSALTHDEMDENLRDLHYLTSTATGAVTTRTKNQKLSDVLSVKDFGAVGNGSANDRSYIQAAIDAVGEDGGVLLFPPGTYYLGTASSAETILSYTSLTNVLFLGYGATLSCQTTDSSQPQIIKLTNPVNVSFQGLNFTDTGADVSVTWQGAQAIALTASGSSGEGGNISIRDVTGSSLVSLLTVAGNTSYRIRGIAVENCRADTTYYGINCQENGDGLKVRGFRTSQVRRPYFVYGVRDHDVELDVTHDGTGSGASAVCLIKRYSRDTHKIKLKAKIDGDLTQYTQTVVSIDFDDDTSAGAGAISDVDVSLDISKDIANYSSATPVRLTSFEDEDVVQTTTTNYWNNIRVSGNLGPYINAQPVLIQSEQSTEGRLYLDASARFAKAFNQLHFPGFVVCTDRASEFRTKKGDLTASALVIPLSKWDSQAVTLLVRVYAHANATTLSGQKSTYSEDLLVGHNASGGNAVLTTTTNLHSVVQSADATISYAASGENFTVSFAGADYANSNSWAIVEVQYVGRWA
jgi:hypothetical protein